MEFARGLPDHPEQQDAAGQSEAEDVQHFEREQGEGDADDGGAGDTVPDGVAALLAGEAVDGEADDDGVVARQYQVNQQDLEQNDEEGECGGEVHAGEVTCAGVTCQCGGGRLGGALRDCFESHSGKSYRGDF